MSVDCSEQTVKVTSTNRDRITRVGVKIVGSKTTLQDHGALKRVINWVASNWVTLGGVIDEHLVAACELKLADTIHNAANRARLTAGIVRSGRELGLVVARNERRAIEQRSVWIIIREEVGGKREGSVELLEKRNGWDWGRRGIDCTNDDCAATELKHLRIIAREFKVEKSRRGTDVAIHATDVLRATTTDEWTLVPGNEVLDDLPTKEKPFSVMPAKHQRGHLATREGRL